METKSNPYHISSFLKAIVLVICFSAFIVTLFIVPISTPYLSIALALGIVHFLISVGGLSGGKDLWFLVVPIVVIGQLIACDVAFGNVTGTRQWILVAQFLAVVLSTDSALTIFFRSRIESFCNRNLSRRT